MSDRIIQLRTKVLHHPALLGPLDGRLRPMQHCRVNIAACQTGLRVQPLFGGVGHLQAHTGDGTTYIHEMSVSHNFLSQNAINKTYPSR